MYSNIDFQNYLSSSKDTVDFLDLSKASILEIVEELIKMKSKISPIYSKSYSSLIYHLKALEKQFNCILMPHQITDVLKHQRLEELQVINLNQLLKNIFVIMMSSIKGEFKVLPLFFTNKITYKVTLQNVYLSTKIEIEHISLVESLSTAHHRSHARLHIAFNSVIVEVCIYIHLSVSA